MPCLCSSHIQSGDLSWKLCHDFQFLVIRFGFFIYILRNTLVNIRDVSSFSAKIISVVNPSLSSASLLPNFFYNNSFSESISFIHWCTQVSFRLWFITQIMAHHKNIPSLDAFSSSFVNSDTSLLLTSISFSSYNG